MVEIAPPRDIFSQFNYHSLLSKNFTILIGKYHSNQHPSANRITNIEKTFQSTKFSCRLNSQPIPGAVLNTISPFSTNFLFPKSFSIKYSPSKSKKSKKDARRSEEHTSELQSRDDL